MRLTVSTEDAARYEGIRFGELLCLAPRVARDRRRFDDDFAGESAGAVRGESEQIAGQQEIHDLAAPPGRERALPGRAAEDAIPVIGLPILKADRLPQAALHDRGGRLERAERRPGQYGVRLPFYSRGRGNAHEEYPRDTRLTSPSIPWDDVSP